jgi:hypothetical protein
VSLTNYALRQEGVWGSGCIDPRFLDLGTSWSWVVSFTSRPLYPRDPLDRRLGGPLSRYGGDTTEVNLFLYYIWGNIGQNTLKCLWHGFSQAKYQLMTACYYTKPFRTLCRRKKADTLKSSSSGSSSFGLQIMKKKRLANYLQGLEKSGFDPIRDTVRFHARQFTEKTWVEHRVSHDLKMAGWDSLSSRLYP